MRIFKVIRSAEWWSHKLPPLLAIGYATGLMSPIPLLNIAPWYLFLLGSLVIGAIYVSVVNDITDLQEDLASGKPNRIQLVPANVRWIIPITCLGIGCVFGYFFYPDIYSCLLYLLSWIVFSCYSIKPIRLKDKGILGVLADGCGSHLFPSLLMVASVCYVTNQQINVIWFCAVGVWALFYGFRGILWHQFADKDNDVKVNLNTYASKIDPRAFKIKSKLIILIELAALIVMLTELSLLTTYISLLLYFILVYLRYVAYRNEVVLIIKPDKGPFQILMADYYQMFFPVSLLLFASFTDKVNLYLMVLHILLFPNTFWLAIYDYTRILALKAKQFFHKFH